MSWTYRDAGGLARAARCLLWTQAALSAVSALLALTRDSLIVDKTMIQLLGVAEMLVFLGCVAAVLAWTYRANANARANGATDMMVSPGWAVGWYFVPLAYLAMPFVATRELWKASANPKDWQLIKTPPVLIVWWACWLAAFIAFNLAIALAAEPDPDAVPVGQTFYLATDVFAVPAALALAHIIGRVQALQTRVRAEGVFG